MPSFRHVVPPLIHTSTTTEQKGCVCFLGPHYCLHKLSNNCQQNQLPTQFACYSTIHIQASVASWLKQHLLFDSEVCYCTNIFNGCCSTQRCIWYNPDTVFIQTARCVFTTFSRVVSRCMGAAMFGLTDCRV